MNAPALHVSPSVPSKIGRTMGCLAGLQTAATLLKITAITSYTKEAISTTRVAKHSAT